MDNNEKLCLDTAIKLGRTLEQKELEFLAWLCERHNQEIAQKEKRQNVTAKPTSLSG